MKKIRVYTALWNVDTKVSRQGRAQNQVRNLSPVERYGLLASVVRSAFLSLYQQKLEDFAAIDEDVDWLYLFVAPEYYFAASDSAHAIPQDQKEIIIGFLKTLSGEIPNLVLVPGTIAWKKPVLRSGPSVFVRGTNTLKPRGRLEKFIERNTAAAEEHAALVPHAVDRSIAEQIQDADGDRERIRDLRSSEYRRRRTDLFSADVDVTRQATSQMILNMKKSQDRCSIARNTAYAFRAGREVARYHKRGNYFEVLPSESDGGYVIFEPGGGPEGPGDRFTVDHVKFGVEVCLDHQIGYLSQTGGWYPDVQIIMSAATPLIEEHSFIVDGGYIVHASSERDCTGVYRKRRGRIEPVETRNEHALVGELLYATLDLNVNDGPRIIDNYS